MRRNGNKKPEEKKPYEHDTGHLMYRGMYCKKCNEMWPYKSEICKSLSNKIPSASR